jgi:hypothetical protein
MERIGQIEAGRYVYLCKKYRAGKSGEDHVIKL